MSDAGRMNIIRMWSAAEDEVDALKIRIQTLARRFEEIRDTTTDGNARAIAKNSVAEIESWSGETAQRIRAHAVAQAVG